MVTARFHDDTPDVDGLYADLAAADLQPLWTQPGLLTRGPTPGPPPNSAAMSASGRSARDPRLPNARRVPADRRRASRSPC